MNTPTIKPCTKCNGLAAVDGCAPRIGDCEYHVECMRCKHSGPWSLSETAAVQYWNAEAECPDRPGLLPCPFCGDKMLHDAEAGIIKHINQGDCIIGQMAWMDTWDGRWNKRRDVE